MLKYLSKTAFAFIILIFISKYTDLANIYNIQTMSIDMLLFGIFAYLLVLELIFLLFKSVITALKNDVLISNHDFLGDGATIESTPFTESDKIVLSRNQLDEAALLIVKTMSAISSRLMSEAREHITNLKQIIGDDAIVDIMMLKIYKSEKNFDKMSELSQKLMQNEDIQLVGMKAALEAQLEKKDFTEALKTVNQAFGVRQDLYWVISSAFLLRAQNNDWTGALEVLQAGLDKNITPLPKASRLKAVALYELSKQAAQDCDKTKYFKFITQALSEDARLFPAALDLAEYYMKNDHQIRKAEEVLFDAWLHNPSYDVAHAYLKLFSKDKKNEKIQKMEKLVQANNKRPSLNYLLLAELYIENRKYSKAKTECKMFLLKNPATQKMAEFLDILHDKLNKNKKSNTKSNTSKNLLKVEDCPKDFQWVCAKCGHVSDDWNAICPECGEIGRNYWHLYVDKHPPQIDN